MINKGIKEHAEWTTKVRKHQIRWDLALQQVRRGHQRGDKADTLDSSPAAARWWPLRYGGWRKESTMAMGATACTVGILVPCAQVFWNRSFEMDLFGLRNGAYRTDEAHTRLVFMIFFLVFHLFTKLLIGRSRILQKKKTYIYCQLSALTKWDGKIWI